MEVVSLEDQQVSFDFTSERVPKRPRVDEGQMVELEVPTEQCRKHHSLYLEDGNVVLRCEDTLFRFYIGLLARKSEIFHDMFRLAPLQPNDSEKTVDGLPVVRLHDPAEDFAHLLSALLDYESLFLQKYMQYQRFAALLRLSMKYEMSGVRKILIHRIQKHYPVTMNDYERVMTEHGTAAAAAFTLSPHPNEVLKLFWECEVKHCLPVAFYEATTRGINSLTSRKPQVALPPLILTPALKALGSFNTLHVEHVRNAMDTFRACAQCRRAGLVSVEHFLLPTKSDLSLSPLREQDMKPEVLRILCGNCASELADEEINFRCALWNELPKLFGLPNWGELSSLVVLK